MSFAENFLQLRKEVPKNIEIIVVTKFQEKDSINEVYNTGHRVFAENKVQEILRKRDMLPSDVQWHMIGHMQTNKVKYIAPFISMIHSIDSLKLLKEVNKQALKNNRIIDCLLQFHIATEETKFGLNSEEAIEILHDEQFPKLQNINICGVMGMGSFSDDIALVRAEFRHLRKIFQELKHIVFADNDSFRHLSMGMTNDYQTAIEEGTTMLRIGSLIFQ
jgi:PLP dependent protein